MRVESSEILHRNEKRNTEENSDANMNKNGKEITFLKMRIRKIICVAQNDLSSERLVSLLMAISVTNWVLLELSGNSKEWGAAGERVNGVEEAEGHNGPDLGDSVRSLLRSFPFGFLSSPFSFLAILSDALLWK